MSEQLWKVVGGAERGGILVRCGPDLKSVQAADRLATGAVIREVACVGERVNYVLVEGHGPATGWVSIKLKEKILLEPSREHVWNPYEILGIHWDATNAQVKSAFRYASLKCHPDRHPDDPHAVAQFQELTRAKDFLLSPLKRTLYNLKHKYVKPTENVEWWLSWDATFAELDTNEDVNISLDEALAGRGVPQVGPPVDRIDVLVLGATGFVGMLVCAMLQDQAASDCWTWAIAGRNEDRLGKVEDKFGRKSCSFLGSFCTPGFADLARLACKAKVVVNLIGPSQDVHNDINGLIQACIASRTHYIDISKDAVWSRDVRDHWGTPASEAGVCLITGAGVNSLLVDVPSHHLVKHLSTVHDTQTSWIHAYHWVTPAWLNNGTQTYEMMAMSVPGRFELGGARAVLEDPKTVPKNYHEDLDEVSGCWTNATQDMDTVVVHASAALFTQIGKSYGENFSYFDKMLQPDQRTAELFHMGMRFATHKQMYETNIKNGKVVPRGYGVGELQRQQILHTKIFVGQGAKENCKAHCICRIGPGGLGYVTEGTAMCVVQSAFTLLDALALLKNDPDIPHSQLAGFVTPAFALTEFGILERLTTCGLSLSLHDGWPPDELWRNVLESTLSIS